MADFCDRLQGAWMLDVRQPVDTFIAELLSPSCRRMKDDHPCVIAHVLRLERCDL